MVRMALGMHIFGLMYPRNVFFGKYSEYKWFSGHFRSNMGGFQVHSNLISQAVSKAFSDFLSVLESPFQGGSTGPPFEQA